MSNFDDIFESVPQTDEFDKEAWAAKKKAERDEVYALADATAETICTDGSKFRDYLDVQAAFRNYSATNALLILATKPDARRLGDKDFWRDQGVYIKRQEFGRPIKIVESNGEYTRDDGSIGVSYNIKRVYDISQTTAWTRTPFLSAVACRQTTFSADCPKRWRRRSLTGPARNTPKKIPVSRRGAFPISLAKSSVWR